MIDLLTDLAAFLADLAHWINALPLPVRVVAIVTLCLWVIWLGTRIASDGATTYK